MSSFPLKFYAYYFMQLLLVTTVTDVKVILVKNTWFIPYAMFWKTYLASSQSGILIKCVTYLSELSYL